MKQVYDGIRRQWVAATPEELVRQSWIQRMVHELQFPKELLAIEKELKTLPHLQYYDHPLPSRRIDILSFAHAMTPLLLIECKDHPLSQEAMEQALAYNSFVKAPYVAIVNQDQIRLKSPQGEMDRLPNFSELL
jgi:sulfur carrier protein ThiS